MSNPTTARKFRAVKARQAMNAAFRRTFEKAGFDEIEPPLLIPAPGMEPHINVFETRFVPEMGATMGERPLWLHSSPEYAMKRLLAEGWERIYSLGKVFRNGEIATFHNPEFTMLEFYRANLADDERAGRGYGPILSDLEELTLAAAEALGVGPTLEFKGGLIDLTPPWDRLSVSEAFASRAGIELPLDGDVELLRARGRERGFDLPDSLQTFDDVFFAIFLSIEPGLGWPRPTFLVDWPASMASLARLRVDDPTIAERFELYIGGVELANGFFELNDSVEQRRRLEEEQAFRKKEGKPVYPIDDRFVEAVGRMPTSAGVALGVDRLLMILAGFESIDQVVLFPSSEELR